MESVGPTRQWLCSGQLRDFAQGGYGRGGGSLLHTGVSAIFLMDFMESAASMQAQRGNSLHIKARSVFCMGGSIAELKYKCTPLPIGTIQSILH
jgi:hypothetical protein